MLVYRFSEASRHSLWMKTVVLPTLRVTGLFCLTTGVSSRAYERNMNMFNLLLSPATATESKQTRSHTVLPTPQ